MHSSTVADKIENCQRIGAQILQFICQNFCSKVQMCKYV